MVLCCFTSPHARPRRYRESPEPPVRPLPVHAVRRQMTGEHVESPGSFSLETAPPHSQQQSLFITRIPPELRLICWEYTLGSDPDGDVLHLESVDGILKHCRCFDNDKTKLSFRHKCWKAVWKKKSLDQGNWYSREPFEDRRKLLPLVMTCKLLYREAIDVVYSSNTFSLHRSESIIRMPQMMLPHRFERIRSIQFSSVFLCPILPDTPCERSGNPPENALKWRAACNVLASLQHLEYLELTFAIWSRTMSQRDGADDDSMVVLLGPLKNIRATRFSVVLTESLTDEVLRRLGPIPFVVSKRQRPGIGYYSGKDDD